MTETHTLRMWIRLRGLSISEFADRVGVSITHPYHWFKYPDRLTLRHLRRICEVLQITVYQIDLSADLPKKLRKGG